MCFEALVEGPDRGRCWVHWQYSFVSLSRRRFDARCHIGQSPHRAAGVRPLQSRILEGDIADESLVDRVFDEHPDIDAALLCAALINVPESVREPALYYEENVVKALRFVSKVIERGCSRLIFSSTASVYGTSDTPMVDEDAPLRPESAYARTKAACEGMFDDLSQASPLRVISLRYFNPIGADPRMRTGLQFSQPTHALGRLISCLEQGDTFVVAGTDFPTRDGTGIRDYVHVWDLALAHVAALQRQFDDIVKTSRYEVINLGTGRGTTVRELIEAFNSVVPAPVAIGRWSTSTG